MFPWGESHMQPEGSGIFVPPRFCHSHSCWNGPSNFWLLKCTFMQSKTGNEKAEIHSFRRQRVFGGWHFTGLCKTEVGVFRVRAPKLEKSNSCMSKTLVNAMFFGVKRLPPGDPCCAQSTAVDNSQRNVDSSLSKTLANAMFFRLRRLPPGGLFSKLRIVDFFLE